MDRAGKETGRGCSDQGWGGGGLIPFLFYSISMYSTYESRFFPRKHSPTPITALAPGWKAQVSGVLGSILTQPVA